MSLATAIIGAASGVFSTIGGIVQGRQQIRYVEELQQLEEYEMLPEWIDPTQFAEEIPQDNTSNIAIGGLLFLITALIIANVTLRK